MIFQNYGCKKQEFLSFSEITVIRKTHFTAKEKHIFIIFINVFIIAYYL